MKRCIACGKLKSLADFHINRKASDGRQSRCRDCVADYMRERYQAAPETARENVRKHNEMLRKAVFDHYGWTCACCGSSDDPTVDHVNGGGKAHREQLLSGKRGGHGGHLYRWLIGNDFPEGFQTLCRPCNGSKKESDRCHLDHAREMSVT
jgi:5-methylcytosine-specific restriction endonuclease McrA